MYRDYIGLRDSTRNTTQQSRIKWNLETEHDMQTGMIQGVRDGLKAKHSSATTHGR